MLKGNLATRPFYNERLVTLALVLVALVALGASVFNARRLLDLSSQRAALGAKIDANEQQVAQIRHDADAVQRTVDRKHLQTLVSATHEANDLIDQRTFSWTTLFGVIEKTLPIDVRLVAVAPKIDKDNTLVTMLVVARKPEALADFVAALEGPAAGGTFYDVIKHADQRNDDGTIDATIEAYYLPPTGSLGGTTRNPGKGRGGADGSRDTSGRTKAGGGRP